MTGEMGTPKSPDALLESMVSLLMIVYDRRKPATQRFKALYLKEEGVIEDETISSIGAI
jgi:hypothetical protein